jgi:acyl dehydratase
MTNRRLVIGPVTRTDFVRYAGASGDFNPLHHDEPFCLAAGFPSPFSMGMFQAGVLGTLATVTRRPEAVREFRVRFVRPLWPGEVLHCEEESATLDEDGSSEHVSLIARTEAGDIVVMAWVTFAVD